MAAREKSTPEDLVERLREIGDEFEEITALSFAERRHVRNKLKMSEETLETSVATVGASEKISDAIGRSAEDVLRIFSDRRRWMLVEGELRTLLNGVSSANLMRRHQLELIGAQAYSIALQLARDPKNASLIPFVEEIQRLRKLDRRRRTGRTASDEAPPEPES